MHFYMHSYLHKILFLYKVGVADLTRPGLTPVPVGFVRVAGVPSGLRCSLRSFGLLEFSFLP
jgi:hypothetical protein